MTPSPISELLATGISYNFLLVSGVNIIVLCAISSLVPFLLLDQSAFATFPGENGKIAFSSTRDGNYEIYVMNADGSGQTQLTDAQNTNTNYYADWSPDGRKIAFTSDREDGNYEIYVMNADGSNPTMLTNSDGNDEYPDWSPDGRRIAFSVYSVEDNKSEIYVMNADGSNPTMLTDSPELEYFPSWSPDGRKIAFSSTRDGNWEVYVMNADGSGQTQLTSSADKDNHKPNWSPDGKKIAFASINFRDGNWEVYVMNADGSGQTRLTNNPAADRNPSWSPDGRKIAFTSDREDGNYEIYVMNADGTGQINISDNPAADDFSDWGPAPTPSPPPADTIPPVLTVPQDITAQAATANGGTVVTYNVTAEDNMDGTASLEEDGTAILQDDVGGDIAISCDPPSDSEFPIGDTEVQCTATDANDNSNTASFMVTVNPPPPDASAPIMTVPEDMTVEATGPDGAQVSFALPSARDDVDGPVDVTCDYDSGDTFLIGGTVVTCSAEDAAGNRAEETFTITVQDTTDPDVGITQVVDRRNRVLNEGDTTPTPYIRVTFQANDAVGVEDIECNLDGQGFTSCISPVVYDRLSRGSHQVTVRATDEAGNTGEDRFLFTIGSPSSLSVAAAAPGRQ